MIAILAQRLRIKTAQLNRRPRAWLVADGLDWPSAGAMLRLGKILVQIDRAIR